MFGVEAGCGWGEARIERQAMTTPPQTRPGHSIELMDLLRDFVRAQRRLCDALAYDSLSADPCLLGLPKRGEVISEGETWRWQKHGVGVLFVNAITGAEVDVCEHLDNPYLFKGWRLQGHCDSIGLTHVRHGGAEHAASERVIDGLLATLVDEGVLGVDARPPCLFFFLSDRQDDGDYVLGADARLSRAGKDVRFADAQGYADFFDGRGGMRYDLSSDEEEDWLCYSVCSLSDPEAFLCCDLPSVDGWREIREFYDWFDVWSFQHDVEDQAVPGVRVTITESRDIFGVRPLAAQQFHPLRRRSALSAAILGAGVPEVCRVWTREGSGIFKAALLLWRNPAVVDFPGADAYDRRVLDLLRPDEGWLIRLRDAFARPRSARVMFVTKGYVPEENPRNCLRKQAWRDFGFKFDERVPALESIRPGQARAFPGPRLDDLFPASVQADGVLDPHRYFMHFAVNPYELGRLDAVLCYWVAVGIHVREIPADAKRSHPWVVARSLAMLERYIASGHVELVRRPATVLPLGQEKPVEVLAPLPNVMDEIRQVMLAGASRLSLRRWGLRATDRGWAERLRLEPTLDAFIQDALAYDERHGTECLDLG